MEKISIGGVTLHGFAQGGCQTAFHVPEIRAVFDAGAVPGATVDHVFLTHGHADHVAALPYIVSLRSIRRNKATLSVYLPDELGEPMERLLEAMRDVQRDSEHEAKVRLYPARPGYFFELGRGAVVHAMRSWHRGASLGWGVDRTTSKLKTEFVGMEGSEIGRLRREGVQVTDDVVSTLLVVSGDTRIDFLLEHERARRAKVLVHEVTTWEMDDANVEGARRYGHTHVAEMAEHCEKFEGDYLVLTHRSMKHSREEAEEILRRRFPAAMLDRILLFDGGDR